MVMSYLFFSATWFSPPSWFTENQWFLISPIHFPVRPRRGPLLRIFHTLPFLPPIPRPDLAFISLFPLFSFFVQVYDFLHFFCTSPRALPPNQSSHSTLGLCPSPVPPERFRVRHPPSTVFSRPPPPPFPTVWLFFVFFFLFRYHFDSTVGRAPPTRPTGEQILLTSLDIFSFTIGLPFAYCFGSVFFHFALCPPPHPPASFYLFPPHFTPFFAQVLSLWPSLRATYTVVSAGCVTDVTWSPPPFFIFFFFFFFFLFFFFFFFFWIASPLTADLFLPTEPRHSFSPFVFWEFPFPNPRGSPYLFSQPPLPANFFLVSICSPSNTNWPDFFPVQSPGTMNVTFPSSSPPPTFPPIHLPSLKLEFFSTVCSS